MCVCKTFEMLTFGKSTMSRTQVQLWYNRFKEGREDISEDVHSGRTNTLTTNENIGIVNKMASDNRRITIREFTDYGDISFLSCQAVFMEHCSKIAKF